MPWLRHRAVLFAFVAAFVWPAPASAFSPASSGTRVGGFEVAAHVLAGELGAASLEQHQGIGAAYDENASGYRFAAEEVLRQAVTRPAEMLNGFRVFGNKGLVGKIFQRNVLLIEAEKKGAASLRGLVGAMEAEARGAGASQLRIVGHAIVNNGFFSPAIARRFGFAFERINETTIALTKRL
jgi:hypothetical protein